MKTIGMSFGFSTVNAGQRNIISEPQLIVSSTEGTFRITAPISRVLNVANGDNIAFVTNIDNINEAILNKAPELVAYCNEVGLDINSQEASIEIHKEFDMWGIYKGVEEFDSKGNHKVYTERLSKRDKLTFVEQNFQEMYDAAMNSTREDIKAALQVEGITKEEQMDILVEFVQPRELMKYTGSKVSNVSGLNGVGVPLNFTDSNIWNQLKVDLGTNATKVNRIFDLDVDNVITITIFNGYENVNVPALLLTSYVDKEVARK